MAQWRESLSPIAAAGLFSNPVSCGLRLLLVLAEGFPLSSSVFLPPQKPIFQILFQRGESGQEEPPYGMFTAKIPFAIKPHMKLQISKNQTLLP